MDNITEKRRIRQEAMKDNLSLIKQCFSFYNEHQRECYLTYLQEAKVDTRVRFEIKKILNPDMELHNQSIVGSNRWDRIFHIMIDQHGLTHPTWQFILDHGNEELKKRLKETHEKIILKTFDQLFRNRKLGTLAADRKQLIAEDMLDRLEHTVKEIQKEYETKNEELPINLDDIIPHFRLIEKGMQYLLGDETVSYSANLIKKNNPIRVIEELLKFIERLSNDLSSACGNVTEKYDVTKEELDIISGQLTKLMEENKHLKEDKENLQVELETKQQECTETAWELVEKKAEAEEAQQELAEKTSEAQEAQKELSKRDVQFDKMQAFMYTQSEHMAIQENTINKQSKHMAKQEQTINKQGEHMTKQDKSIKDIKYQLQSVTAQNEAIKERQNKMISSLSSIENGVNVSKGVNGKPPNGSHVKDKQNNAGQVHFGNTKYMYYT